MAFPREYVDYGVVKLNKFSYYNGVSVYKGQNDYMNLQGFSGSASAEDARWSGSAIIVTMRDGEVRRYTDFSSFNRV